MERMSLKCPPFHPPPPLFGAAPFFFFFFFQSFSFSKGRTGEERNWGLLTHEEREGGESESGRRFLLLPS